MFTATSYSSIYCVAHSQRERDGPGQIFVGVGLHATRRPLDSIVAGVTTAAVGVAVMDKVKTGLDFSEHVLGLLCVIILVAMFVLGVTQVFYRYVLEQSLSFPSELIRYLFVWSISLGSAIAVRRNSHAAVELFVNYLPKMLRHWALIGAMVISGVFFLILMLKGFDLAQRVYPQSSPAMRISMSYAYAAIPVGAALMLIYTIERMIQQMLSRDRADDKGSAAG